MMRYGGQKQLGLSEQYQQQIIDTIQRLSEEELAEIADFVKTYQHRLNLKKNIVKLSGLWEGFEPTDQEIQEAQKEIWRHLD